MSIGELLKAVDLALQERAAPTVLEPLRRRLAQAADMTGWASGVIDPQGRLDEVVSGLQERAKALYLEHQDPATAELHDALGELRQAIAQHDADFEAPQDEDEDDSFS